MLLRSPLSSRPDASPRAALLSLTRSRAPSCCCLARHGRTHAHGRHVRAHAADIGSGDGEACHDGRAHALHMARHATPPRGGARALTWCRHAPVASARACARSGRAAGSHAGSALTTSAGWRSSARPDARARGRPRTRSTSSARGAGRPAGLRFIPRGSCWRITCARTHASSATPCFIRLRCSLQVCVCAPDVHESKAGQRKILVSTASGGMSSVD